MRPLLSRSRLLFVAALTLSTGTATAANPVTLLRTPGGGIQPQAVMDAKGVLHLVYLKGTPEACDVFYVRRETGSTNFSTPLRVNSQPGSAIAIGTVRGAQLALGRNGSVHVAWNGSRKAEPILAGGTPMLYSRLKESGEGFESQRNLMTATTHLDGGGSVAADDLGNVYVVWHAHRLEGPQDELHRAVFVAKSVDDGRTFAPEKQASPEGTGACGCCGLKTFADKQGGLAILYRSATADGTRDVTLLLSSDRGGSFQSTILGPWRIAVCPMSTMSLAQGPEEELVAAWETQGQVFQATIAPDRLTSTPRRSTPAGSSDNRKHPALAFSGKGNQHLLMAWTEGTGWEKGGALAWEYSEPGKPTRLSGRADGVPVWGRVTAVAEPDGSFTVIY